MDLLLDIALVAFGAAIAIAAIAVFPGNAWAEVHKLDYRGVLDSAVDMIQTTAANGSILYVNNAWREALGYSDEELAELAVYNLVGEDYGEEFSHMFEQAAGGTAVPRFESVLTAKDGREVSVSGSMGRGVGEGDTHVVLCVFQDITERKRAEEVLVRQATDLIRANDLLDEKDREFAETLEQARKYREAQERAEELARINTDLEGEIERRVEAEKKITASLREKEVLLKEIHHRVKNNLQIISSLLSLQAGQIEDGQVHEMFDVSQSRVRTMALLHEKLYQSGDLARVDFAEYIKSLVGFLFRSYGSQARGVTPQLDIADLHLGLDTAIPCGLVINELVSNALKHAFTDRSGGEIRVALHTDEERLILLEISDNGGGFPEDVDFRNTESLGLQLVVTLADQLGGEIDLDRSEGTTFRLTFRPIEAAPG